MSDLTASWQVYDEGARFGPRRHILEDGGEKNPVCFQDNANPVMMTERWARIFIGKSGFSVVAPDGRTWDDHWSGEVPPETQAALDAAALEAATLADTAAATPAPEPITLPPGYAVVAADEIERWPLLRLCNAMGGDFGKSATKDGMVAFLITTTHAAPIVVAEAIADLEPIPLPEQEPEPEPESEAVTAAETISSDAAGDDDDDDTDDTVIEVSDGDDALGG